MWSIAHIAERDGVSKQAVSKHVGKLVGAGLEVERDGQGRVVAVNVAAYDHLRGRFADPAKAQAPRRPVTPDDRAAESYEEAKRAAAWLNVEREKIKLQVDRGELVSRAAVEARIDQMGAALVRVIDRLPNATDEISAAMVKHGTHGVRTELRDLAVRLRRDMTAAILDAAAQLVASDVAEAEPD